MAKVNLGRVGFVMQGAYDSSKTYKRLDCVTANNVTYSAKEDVPAGTPVTNTQYWQVVLDGQGIAQDVTQLKDDIDALENGRKNYTDGILLKQDGTEAPSDRTCVTDFIPVSNSTKYRCTAYSEPIGGITLYVVEYDADKKAVDYWSANPYRDFTTSPRTVYVRFTFINGYEATAVQSGNGDTVYKAERISGLRKEIEKKQDKILAGDGILIEDDTVSVGSIGIDHMGIYQHDPSSNYYRPDKDIAGEGYIQSDGTPRQASGMRYTGYIALDENTAYYTPAAKSNFYSEYYAFYDVDKKMIASYSTLGQLGHPFVTPEGTAFARFTILNSSDNDKAYISLTDGQPAPYRYKIVDGLIIDNGAEGRYCDYAGDDICTFNRILCIGDSLTEGVFNHRESGEDEYTTKGEYSYPTYLHKITGVDVVNKGHSGDTSAQWLEHERDTDLSGFDCAIIQFGVNDRYQYGGWTQTSVNAFRNIINKLKNENQKIKIFVATVIPAISYSGDVIDEVSQGIRDFVASMDDADVILLDMAVHGHTGETSAYNCGHLSAYGYYRLARDYKGIISYYMSNNKGEFRQIQFIGTAMRY